MSESDLVERLKAVRLFAPDWDGPAVVALAHEAAAEIERLRAATQWQPIDSAPKDGTAFIACNLDHPEYGSWLMMRRVRYAWEADNFAQHDLGSWLHIRGIEPDYGEDAPPVQQEPSIAIAPDQANKNARYGWMPLPPPPREETGNE